MRCLHLYWRTVVVEGGIAMILGYWQESEGETFAMELDQCE